MRAACLPLICALIINLASKNTRLVRISCVLAATSELLCTLRAMFFMHCFKPRLFAPAAAALALSPGLRLWDHRQNDFAVLRSRGLAPVARSPELGHGRFLIRSFPSLSTVPISRYCRCSDSDDDDMDARIAQEAQSQSQPVPAEHPPRHEDEAEEEVAAQPRLSSSQEVEEHMEEMETHARREYIELIERVKGSADPSKDFLQRLVQHALRAWSRATGNDITEAELRKSLPAATSSVQNEFFKHWTRLMYNTKAVYAASELDEWQPGDNVEAFVRQKTQEFYSRLLDPANVMSPAAFQKEVPLEAVLPRELANACARISTGYGLPPDGHVVGQALQSQAIFYWRGAAGGTSSSLCYNLSFISFARCLS